MITLRYVYRLTCKNPVTHNVFTFHVATVDRNFSCFAPEIGLYVRENESLYHSLQGRSPQIVSVEYVGEVFIDA